MKADQPRQLLRLSSCRLKRPPHLCRVGFRYSHRNQCLTKYGAHIFVGFPDSHASALFLDGSKQNRVLINLHHAVPAVVDLQQFPSEDRPKPYSTGMHSISFSLCTHGVLQPYMSLHAYFISYSLSIRFVAWIKAIIESTHRSDHNTFELTIRSLIGEPDHLGDCHTL